MSLNKNYYFAEIFKIMKNNIFLFFTLIGLLNVYAQSKKEKDKDAIKKMCGCYEVTFNFSETFNYSDDSTYVPSKNKISYALEWIDLTYEDKSKLVLQHILQIGKGEKVNIIKHWRQDWIYENTDLLVFAHNKKWKKNKLEPISVDGQWTQKVYQVDDSPRYEGSATWIHVDGKSFWENTTDAPLPRREYTKRNDYNVINRGNRVEITRDGWLHDQDNKKIIRADEGDDILLAREIGFNIYNKVDNDRCQFAVKWWKENFEKWKIVREEWGKVFDSNTIVHIRSKVDDKHLHEYLLSKDYSNKESIAGIIKKFLK